MLSAMAPMALPCLMSREDVRRMLHGIRGVSANTFDDNSSSRFIMISHSAIPVQLELRRRRQLAIAIKINKE